MILIEIKKEARYLKKKSQTLQEKNCENLNRWLLGQLARAFQLNSTLGGLF